MNADQQQQWATILKLTAEMRELAVPNETLADLSIDEAYASQPWQKIAQLESNRTELLKTFLSAPRHKSMDAEIAKGLQQIQQSDQALQAISQSLKIQIGDTFSKLGDAQRAASAYAVNATHR